MQETHCRVFVVDDDEAVRQGIRELLASVHLDALCFASGEEFLQAYQPGWHGCLLLDIRMPGMSGLKLQEELIRRDSALAIVFLTGHGDVPMAVGALKKGAADFIEKPPGDQQLLDVVHEVLREDARQREARKATQHVEQKLARLTDRERQVLEALEEGKSPKTMAHELSLSRKTVDWHISSLRRKMGCQTNEQLLMTLYKAGLLLTACGPHSM